MGKATVLVSRSNNNGEASNIDSNDEDESESYLPLKGRGEGGTNTAATRSPGGGVKATTTTITTTTSALSPTSNAENTNNYSFYKNNVFAPHTTVLLQSRPKGFETMMKDSRSFAEDESEEECDDDDDDDLEEEEDNASVGFSEDDNSSLGGSDAYFRPQPGDDLARPFSRFIFGYNNGPINPYQTRPPPPSSVLSSSPTVSYGSLQLSVDGSLQYSVDGSVQFSSDLAMAYSMDSRSNHLAPWLGGVPIQEDTEASIPYNHSSSHHHHVSRQSSSSSTPMVLLPPITDADADADLSSRDLHEETAPLLPGIPLHHSNISCGSSSSCGNPNNPGLGGGSSSGKQLKPKHKKRRNKSRQQQHFHRMQMRAREILMSREKVVSLVRGRIQDLTVWQDSFWAILFVIQLVMIILCALRYGFGVILFKIHPAWGSLLEEDDNNNDRESNYTNNTLWRDVAINGTRFLVALVNQTAANASLTTSSFNQDDDLIGGTSSSPNATLKDVLFAVDDTLLKTDDILEEATAMSAGGSFTIDYKNALAVIFFAGFYACILSYISFGFMLILARSLILVMLIFSIVVALAWGVIGLTLDPYGIISFTGFAALLSSLGYTMYSWNRIPFAATNLYTALTAMRCIADIIILGLMSLVVAFGWCLLWSMAFIGMVNAINHHDCTTKDDCDTHFNGTHIPLYLLFFVSFHWTSMVIKNVVRVTVASAVGTWWCHPADIRGFCSSAIMRPLLRSLTYSLGSICLGSLIVGPAQVTLSLTKLCCCCIDGDETHDENLQCMGHNGNGNGGKFLPFLSFESVADADDGTGVVADVQATVDSPADSIYRRCCTLARPCNRWLRACNRWGFTYIGLYGYPFVEAGDRALQLFDTRGWMEVVEDSLIQNVLLMASVVIGGSTGVFAVIVEETDGYDFTSFHQPIITAFLIGSLLGYVLSNILLLGVVGSAVNTILVCFAAAPFEFDLNHAGLSHEMREVWSQQLWEPAPAPHPKLLQQKQQLLPYLKTSLPPAAPSSSIT